jgi:predicted transposase/invertase (TIGR01784 family)
MNNTTPLHDNFIRNLLANKKIARDYFKSYLPPFISSRLNFATLTQLPDTYLSDDLKKSMSDTVYSCHRKDRKGTVKVSLLIEHKSYSDKYTSLQIGGYIFSALQKQAQNNEPLSLVIPVLLYHGKGRWQYRTLANLFDNLEEEWKQYLPNFEYIYNDLGILSDAEVEALNNKFLRASFLALKHSFEKDWIEDNAVQLLILAAQGPRSLQKGFIIYLYSRGRLKETLLSSLPEPIKRTVMNTLDIYIEKGRKEGMEKGKQDVIENLITELGLSDKQAARIAEVSEAFVKKVRTALRKKK